VHDQFTEVLGLVVERKDGKNCGKGARNEDPERRTERQKEDSLLPLSCYYNWRKSGRHRKAARRLSESSANQKRVVFLTNKVSPTWFSIAHRTYWSNTEERQRDIVSSFLPSGKLQALEICPPRKQSGAMHEKDHFALFASASSDCRRRSRKATHVAREKKRCVLVGVVNLRKMRARRLSLVRNG